MELQEEVLKKVDCHHYKVKDSKNGTHFTLVYVLGLIMYHFSKFVITKDHACNMIDSLYDVVGDLSAGDTQRSKKPNL